MATIRSELRVGDEGEPEVWSNLGDILLWLDSLPAETNNRIAAEVAHEIRDMLFDSARGAELRPKQ